MTTNTITTEEQEGIKMIIFLLAMDGIEETEENALVGWRNMKDHQKENTRRAFLFFTS